MISVPRVKIPLRSDRTRFNSSLRRRNILKNIVFVRLLEIKQLMAKPRLSEIIDIFKTKTSKQEKDHFLRNLKQLYLKREQSLSCLVDYKY